MNSGEEKFLREIKNAGGDSAWVLLLKFGKEKP